MNINRDNKLQEHDKLQFCIMNMAATQARKLNTNIYHSEPRTHT